MMNDQKKIKPDPGVPDEFKIGLHTAILAIVALVSVLLILGWEVFKNIF